MDSKFLRWIIAGLIINLLSSGGSYIYTAGAAVTRIEELERRVTILEGIAKDNTEGRHRAEEDLKFLLEGQSEIKQLLHDHDERTQEHVRRERGQ